MAEFFRHGRTRTVAGKILGCLPSEPAVVDVSQAGTAVRYFASGVNVTKTVTEAIADATRSASTNEPESSPAGSYGLGR